MNKYKQEGSSRYNESREEKEKASIEKLKAKSKKIRGWLEVNKEKISTQGSR